MSEYIGQTFGNYRLVRLLGKGGFAQIFLGEHLRLESQAALKVLSTQMKGNEVKLLQVEARTIARLEHPHIVRLFDFDVQDDIPYLVMSYAPNGSLRQQHPRGTRLTPQTIMRYLKQIASALHYAHETQIVHRDIKPENMLLDRHGAVQVSDFGIAVVVHSTRSQTLQDAIGTLSYMAPEQIEGMPRPASDQYALAVMIYEWLCGDLPFRGTLGELMALHLKGKPPALAQKGVDPALEKVLLKALEKDPHRRYASVKEFAEAFEQAVLQSMRKGRANLTGKLMLQTLEGATPEEQTSSIMGSEQTLLSVGSGAVTGLGRMGRRSILLGGTGLLVLAGGGAGALWFWRRAQEQAQNSVVFYRKHESSIKTIAWSPDGRRITSAADFPEHAAHVWDPLSGNGPFFQLEAPNTINGLVWSPDGKFIATACGNGFLGGDANVQVWNAASGDQVLTYSGHGKAVLALAWSPDGKKIASGDLDKAIHVWNASTGEEMQVLSGHEGAIYTLAWSPDSKILASGGEDKTIRAWGSEQQEEASKLEMESQVNVIRWSPDGKRLAAGNGSLFQPDSHVVTIWDTSNGNELLTYKGHKAAIRTLAWSPDGKKIASAGSEKVVQVWNSQTGAAIFQYAGHTLSVNTLAWSPTRNELASGSSDGTVQVWKSD
jgi:WD40 repeat protein